jgi:hypothetical protein
MHKEDMMGDGGCITVIVVAVSLSSSDALFPKNPQEQD